MVPLYNVFCDVTGLNGKTGAISVAEANQMQVDESREIKIEFTSSVNQNGLWAFHPLQPSMTVHPGKPYTTTFFAKNQQDYPCRQPVYSQCHAK
ncbi:MAG: cytochrome c oxidase assembly protein [Thiolinea sp.]